jgi:hypothetical protein
MESSMRALRQAALPASMGGQAVKPLAVHPRKWRDGSHPGLPTHRSIRIRAQQDKACRLPVDQTLARGQVACPLVRVKAICLHWAHSRPNNVQSLCRRHRRAQERLRELWPRCQQERRSSNSTGALRFPWECRHLGIINAQGRSQYRNPLVSIITQEVPPRRHRHK